MANIRIDDADKALLSQICESRQITQSEAFGLAIRLLYQEELDRQIHSYYDSVDQDPAALEAHKQEVRLLDSSTSDGFLGKRKSKKSGKSKKKLSAR